MLTNIPSPRSIASEYFDDLTIITSADIDHEKLKDQEKIFEIIHSKFQKNTFEDIC